MPKLPVVRPKEMIKFLHLIHPDGRKTTVPFHNKTIAKGTLHGIFKQTEISPLEFNK